MCESFTFMSPCWLLLGQLMACLFTEGTASTSHTAQPNFPFELNRSVPEKCCHHSTVGTPSSLYSSKKCSSTGLTSFLKLPSLGIVTIAGFCGENRNPSIDASCFSVIKLKRIFTSPLVSSSGRASRIALFSAVRTPWLV